MYRKQGDRVIIDISEDEYVSLLVTLGIALGAVMQRADPAFTDGILRLANSINEGNPRFRPYEVAPEPTT